MSGVLDGLSSTHLEALDTTAALHGWGARPRDTLLSTEVVDAISHAAGRAVLQRLWEWEQQRAVQTAEEAFREAQAALEDARKRVSDLRLAPGHRG